MIPNIIHHNRPERLEPLKKELAEQGIVEYRICEGVHARTVYEGINLAHKQIVRWAKEKELSKVLIFEDDIQFTDKGAFDYFMQNEPKDYDLYLGGVFLGKVTDGIVERFTALTCYIVHSRFYNTFLSTDNDKHLDHMLAGLGKYVVCEPMVCRQFNGHSTNTGKYENYDLIFENRKMFKRM